VYSDYAGNLRLPAYICARESSAINKWNYGGSGASGKYQAMPGTWGGYAGYRERRRCARVDSRPMGQRTLEQRCRLLSLGGLLVDTIVLVSIVLAFFALGYWWLS
jgi:hypothetical protein